MLLMGSIFLAITLATPQGLQEYAAKHVEPYEVKCMVKLWNKESSWNPKARNGSHYGLGQMRSTWYRDLSPKKQIQELVKVLTPVERLQILEPLCDKYRKQSRAEIEKDIIEFSRRKGIPRIKTDY